MKKSICNKRKEKMKWLHKQNWNNNSINGHVNKGKFYRSSPLGSKLLTVGRRRISLNQGLTPLFIQYTVVNPETIYIPPTKIDPENYIYIIFAYSNVCVCITIIINEK